jgi:hypothetical protein
MDMSALSTLTPEERLALKAALDEPEVDPMEKLAEVVKFQSDEMKALKEEVAALKTLVIDEIIGAVTETYKANERTAGLTSFKGRYGAQLDPLAEPFKKAFDKDLHESMFDHIDGMRGDEGFTDEVGDSEIKTIVDQIKERLNIKDEPAPAPEGEIGEAPAETGKAEEEPDEMQSMYDEIDRMKKRDESRAAAKSKAEPARKRA